MPTITLTITPEQLEHLMEHGTAALTATLRLKKPKADLPLSPDERDKQQRVVDAWLAHRPQENVGRMWKAMRAIPLDTDRLMQALDTALDWSAGKTLMPEWFAKDHQAWLSRSHLTGWTAETEREAYRK